MASDRIKVLIMPQLELRNLRTIATQQTGKAHELNAEGAGCSAA